MTLNSTMDNEHVSFNSLMLNQSNDQAATEKSLEKSHRWYLCLFTDCSFDDAFAIE